MPETPTYRRTQFSRAINLSALLGWAAVAAPMFTTFNPLLLLVSALIGLPIAFAICCLIGAPVLRRVLRKEVSWAAAVLWGAIIAALIFCVYFTVLYIFISDPPEPHEWRMAAVDLAIFAMKGMVVGATVRWATAPGSSA